MKENVEKIETEKVEVKKSTTKVKDKVDKEVKEDNTYEKKVKSTKSNSTSKKTSSNIEKKADSNLNVEEKIISSAEEMEVETTPVEVITKSVVRTRKKATKEVDDEKKFLEDNQNTEVDSPIKDVTPLLNEDNLNLDHDKAHKHKNKKDELEDDPNVDYFAETNLETGLSLDEIEYRMLRGKSNNVEQGSTKTIPSIVFSNVLTVFNLLNFAIAAWQISIGQIKQCFFLVIVTANIVIGIFQEIRAKKTIDRLSLISAPTVVTLRDGEQTEIAVKDIVLGDVVLLQSGKQICSDAIVKEGGIEVNESLLTGESDAIVKKVGDLLYSGSYVVSGNCKAQVTAVGKDNYIERLTGEAKKYVKPKSDLLRSLKIVIRTVGILIIILGPIYFMQKRFPEWNWAENPTILDYAGDSGAVVTTCGAIIGMIPSGLFLLTSVALAVGVIRLAQNNTLVQELYCIEMLARVDVLCLDKTGTITDGTMSVKGLVEYKNDTGLAVKQLISAHLNALNDDNLTSLALEEKFGRTKKLKTIATIPFSSARKYSVAQFEKYGTFALGAPEFIMKDGYSEIAYDVERNACQGYRVLLLAKVGNPIKDNSISGEITPIALILIEDTIRPEAITTIDYFKNNGVSVRVISGDNPITVSKVSERAGIENAYKYISLDGLSDKEVIRAADKYTVFGRVTPNQKKLLVKTLKGTGHTVAMTGDGVNDILALKESDCSIAMASGSEAARNVSHLVLLDSNFGSMPKVVNEGRRVINNVQKVASLFLTKTIFSTLLLLLSICMSQPYPIKPLQLMLIDFLVIGAPSFVLALEPNNSVVRGKFIVNVLKNALPGALVIVIDALIVFAFENFLGITQDERSTMIVVVATFTAMFVLFRVCRPFNLLRGILFFVMFSIFLVILFFVPEKFMLLPVQTFVTMPEAGGVGDFSKLALLIIMIILAYPTMIVLSEGYGWIKRKINEFLKYLGNSI